MKLISFSALLLSFPSTLAYQTPRPNENYVQNKPSRGKMEKQGTRQQLLSIPSRKLAPPFPNGHCGGTVITIPPEDTFGIDVNLANVNLGGDLVLPPREIKVWLPPGYGYDNSQQRQSRRRQQHPVLYVHDGQNCYEDTESWTGASWRLIGALTRLADHRLILTSSSDTEEEDRSQPPPQQLLLPIVVMIPSQDGDLLPGIRRRHLEYGDSNIPFAQLHADFVAKTLKPLIDSRFATNPAASHTYAIGSSLGGQASLHLMLRHPTLFGGAACLSPAFGPAILDEVIKSKKTGILSNKKIYLDIGGDIDDVKVPLFDVFDHITPEHWWNPGYWWLDTQLQSQVDVMRTALSQIPNVDCCFNQIPGGRHNERAWAQRIDKPLRHLFS